MSNKSIYASAKKQPEGSTCIHAMTLVDGGPQPFVVPNTKAAKRLAGLAKVSRDHWRRHSATRRNCSRTGRLDVFLCLSTELRKMVEGMVGAASKRLEMDFKNMPSGLLYRHAFYLRLPDD